MIYLITDKPTKVMGGKGKEDSLGPKKKRESHPGPKEKRYLHVLQLFPQMAYR